MHRLVAEAFLPNPEQLPEVNHKDTDKGNNAFTNLEWSTSSDNKLHATAHGLYPTGTDHYRWSGGAARNEAREQRRERTRQQYQITDRLAA